MEPIIFIDKGSRFPDPFMGNGMTLRDWFAGQALAGMMVGYHEHPNNEFTCASVSYKAADAMLEARKKKGGAA
jgi:hypothetical protein